jgi:hypothetical protein
MRSEWCSYAGLAWEGSLPSSPDLCLSSLGSGNLLVDADSSEVGWLTKQFVLFVERKMVIWIYELIESEAEKGVSELGLVAVATLPCGSWF